MFNYNSSTISPNLSPKSNEMAGKSENLIHNIDVVEFGGIGIVTNSATS